MNISKTRKWFALAAGGIAIAVTAFFVGRAWAGGIPGAAALTYSGKLEDASGAPLSGDHNISVRLWSAASGGTNPLCSTNAQSITLDGGHFSLALPDECTDAVKASPDTWADVLVDSASLGRTKLGAVPYAVEAAHAVSADNATNAMNATNATNAAGALATQISLLQGQVHSASAFRATLTNQTTIPNASAMQVAFDHVSFDLASEYNATTGAFTVQQAGVYLFVCACEYSPTVAGSLYGAAIYRNGSRVGLTEISASASNGITPEHTWIGQLMANDVITCRTYQYAGADASLYTSGGLTQFEGARLY